MTMSSNNLRLPVRNYPYPLFRRKWAYVWRSNKILLNNAYETVNNILKKDIVIMPK